jgi:endonuclease G
MPEVNLNARPRLGDMQQIGGPDAASREATLAMEAAALEAAPRITPAAAFDGRSGYDADFLGEFKVPLPVPGARLKRDVLPVDGDLDRLDYQHFSVVMSKSRRMAMFVAVNIDGARTVRITRGRDKWFLDGRIPVEAQIGEDLYADNLLDRGHLVRREDPNWGDEDVATIANDDTFHFTNCSPQMGGFNQRVWLGLERYILDNTRGWKERVTVFTGPIFSNSDLDYRGVRIPLAYWKVVAFLGDDGRPSATAYMIDQERQLGELEAAFGRHKTYQRSVRRIARLTGLNFGDLAAFDGFSNEEMASGVQIETPLAALSDIRV